MADGELNVDSLITRLLEGKRDAGQPSPPAAPCAHREGGARGCRASPRAPRGSRGCWRREGEAGGVGRSRAAAGGPGHRLLRAARPALAAGRGLERRAAAPGQAVRAVAAFLLKKKCLAFRLGFPLLQLPG